MVGNLQEGKTPHRSRCYTFSRNPGPASVAGYLMTLCDYVSLFYSDLFNKALNVQKLGRRRKAGFLGRDKNSGLESGMQKLLVRRGASQTYSTEE